ncbi:unnamed protein product, partial [marine sediment metagenome]
MAIGKTGGKHGSNSFASYSVDNDKAFRRRLDLVLDKTGSLKIPFKLISFDFYKSQKSIFNLKSAGKYPEINPKYATAKYKKVGFVYPLLKRTGALMRSVTDPNDSNALLDIKDTYMFIGTNVRNKKGVDYPKFHQSDESRSKIPLRKFMFIGPEAPRFATDEQIGRANRWKGILQEFLIKK